MEMQTFAPRHTKAWGRVEELAPVAAVVFGVFDTDGGQALASGGVGLVAGQDALAALGNVCGGGLELVGIGVVDLDIGRDGGLGGPGADRTAGCSGSECRR